MKKLIADTASFAKETIKGLPEAGAKVGGAIGKGVGMAMKAPFSAVKAMGKAIRGTPPKALSPEETKAKQGNLMKMKKTIKEYKAKHPGFKVPREFRSLE